MTDISPAVIAGVEAINELVSFNEEIDGLGQADLALVWFVAGIHAGREAPDLTEQLVQALEPDFRALSGGEDVVPGAELANPVLAAMREAKA